MVRRPDLGPEHGITKTSQQLADVPCLREQCLEPNLLAAISTQDSIKSPEHTSSTDNTRLGPPATTTASTNKDSPLIQTPSTSSIPR